MSRKTSYFTALQEFDPDAQIYFNAASITDVIEKPSVNVKVLALKAAGLFNGVLYPVSPTSLEAASYNLVDPTKFQLTYINSPSFGPTGVDWDGLTQYARTGIIPSTDLTDQDVHLSYYSRDDIAVARFDLGCQQSISQEFYFAIRWSNNLLFFDSYNSSGGRLAKLNTTSAGLFVASRRTSIDAEGYENGTSLGGISTGGGTVPTIEIYLAAQNSNGTPAFNGTRECAFASIGLGLTDTDVTNLTNIVKVYQQTVISGGRAVA